MRLLLSFLPIVACAALAAEPRTLTLKQAVDLALQQNPDIALARLDEQRAQLEVTAVAEPLLPRLVAGSGLAYTSGMPMSVEGSVPSIVQARAVRSLYNPQQGYLTRKAREEARGAGLSVAGKREEVALETATLFLDLERATRAAQVAERQLEHYRRIEAAVRIRVDDGRELEIEAKRAALNVARSRQKAELFRGEAARQSRALAMALALPVETQIAPALEERTEAVVPDDDAAAIESAVRDSAQLAKLQSDLTAKQLESKSFKALRLPKVDLIAQYALLGRYNNYEDYFNRFQRHNVQFGASIAIPLFANPADEARAAQSLIEAKRIETQLGVERNRISAETRKAWELVSEAETAREVAKLDLDVAREQVTILLAQSEEGRVSLKQLEEARLIESERWRGLYEARLDVERARFSLLRQMNRLVAALH